MFPSDLKTLASRTTRKHGERQGFLDSFLVKESLTLGPEGVLHEDHVEAAAPLLVLRKVRARSLQAHLWLKAYICGACISVCNGIPEATPKTFAGWDAMTDEQLLASLKPAAATVDATRAVMQVQAETLRERGVSWETIGDALGISRQAAWERFSRVSRPSPRWPGHPRI